ncbi:DNA damage-responsive serine/threonine-protein kinase RqkA [subsurface metagenome]
MKRILYLILIIILVQPLSGQKTGDWYIFRGGPELRGVSESRLPVRPKLLWSYHTGDELRSAPVASGGCIVSGSMNGTLYCLDETGRLKWKFETGNGIEAPALIYKGYVYAGNYDGTMYCLDLETGAEKWSFRADNQISGSPNVWDFRGKTLIVFGSYDYYMYCLDAGTGKTVWKYETDNFINGAPAVYKGRAVFGGCDGYLHVVDLESGQLEQKIDVATYVASSAAVIENMAFIGDHDGRFSCVDLGKSGISWTWENEQVHLPFLASPSVTSDRVVIGNEDKYIYCFDRLSGRLEWKFNSGSRVHASVVIAHNRVLSANMRGDLHILDLEDGSEIWSYELGSAITGNPALTEGKFFVASSDGYLYCFGK